MLPMPLDFRKWIEEHRHLLKPPVANKCIYDGDFIVMVVGGPNSRKDYHVDPGPEFFYQLEGEMVLWTQQDGRRVDIPIRAGEIFHLPSFVPHSPQRMAGGIGLVIMEATAVDYASISATGNANIRTADDSIIPWHQRISAASWFGTIAAILNLRQDLVGAEPRRVIIDGGCDDDLVCSSLLYEAVKALADRLRRSDEGACEHSRCLLLLGR